MIKNFLTYIKEYKEQPEDKKSAAQLLKRKDDIPGEVQKLRDIINKSRQDIERAKEDIKKKRWEMQRVETRLPIKMKKKFKVGDKIDISHYNTVRWGETSHNYGIGTQWSFYSGDNRCYRTPIGHIASKELEVMKVNIKSLILKYLAVGWYIVATTKEERDKWEANNSRNSYIKNIPIPETKSVLAEKEVIRRIPISKVNKLFYDKLEMQKKEMTKKAVTSINESKSQGQLLQRINDIPEEINQLHQEIREHEREISSKKRQIKLKKIEMGRCKTSFIGTISIKNTIKVGDEVEQGRSLGIVRDVMSKLYRNHLGTKEIIEKYRDQILYIPNKFFQYSSINGIKHHVKIIGKPKIVEISDKSVSVKIIEVYTRGWSNRSVIVRSRVKHFRKSTFQKQIYDDTMSKTKEITTDIMKKLND